LNLLRLLDVARLLATKAIATRSFLGLLYLASVPLPATLPLPDSLHNVHVSCPLDLTMMPHLLSLHLQLHLRLLLLLQ
jgi:hypothetical protein